ncbi:shootin-1-like [Leptidea sinapis]|uniref:shootin-1-like n=1 Tax=Leptidea sinapis TaxID=189913 RepID=UPI0021C28B9C|nr:shootin-1-like [Leptidea sinapis]
MDNVSECVAEKDKCSCETEPTLAVLRDVHRAYEDKMELISRSQAPDKLEKQIQLLQSWVGDLVAQNTLLARTVEELESELTNKIHSERRKFTEQERHKKICNKINELKINIDSLQKENLTKERDIRRLNKDIQQYEQTIVNLKSNLSFCKCHKPNVSKKDAQVMTDIYCAGSTREQRGDEEPLKEFSASLRNDRSEYQESIQHNMECSGESARAVREVNVTLQREIHVLHQVCAALDEQCRVAALRAQFKDEIIREMRRQLRQAKVKLEASGNKASGQQEQHREAEEVPNTRSLDSLTICCVRQQPRRQRHAASVSRHPDQPGDDSAGANGSGDATSKGQ